MRILQNARREIINSPDAICGLRSGMDAMYFLTDALWYAMGWTQTIEMTRRQSGDWRLKAEYPFERIEP